MPQNKLGSPLKIEKAVTKKANFCTFFRLICFNFRSKLCEKLYSYQNIEGNQIKWVWGELTAKKCFQRLSAKFSCAIHVFINTYNCWKQ